MPQNWILGDLFLKNFGHQGSIKALWEQRWAFPCKLGVYPFHNGKEEDFITVFQHLIKENINDLYDDAYCQAFLPTVAKLVKEADEAVVNGEKDKAISLYKRAAVVYRISRFPYIGTPLKEEAYELQKRAYMNGAALWDVPLKDVIIPHTHAANGDGMEILLYVRIPKDANNENPCGVMLLITGLDGHRPDNFKRTEECLKRGWATVIRDIPGVADCPANRRDPNSGDRLFETILEWIEANPVLNHKRVLGWGLSAGGYYAIRLAHTHASKLIGVVGHDAGTHHYISKEWLKEVDHHEYPFDISRAYLGKYGYSSWDELLEKC